MSQINLYQFIGVPNSATTVEIDAAIFAKYNEVRRLVSHHDPTIVNQANSSLQVIEHARTILLDPQKKSAYDASIGLGSATGGLADPQAILQRFNPVMAATPPAGRPGETNFQAAPIVVDRADSWVCPACQTLNPIGTRFCKKCGKEIGVPCPNCQSLVETHATYCQKCGVNVPETVLKRDEELRMQQMAEAEEKRIAEEQLAILGPIVKTANIAQNSTIIGFVLTVVLGTCTYGLAALVGIPVLIFALFNARKALSYSQIPGDTAYRNRAKLAFWVSAVTLALTAMVIVVLIIIAIVGAVSQYS